MLLIQAKNRLQYLEGKISSYWIRMSESAWQNEGGTSPDFEESRGKYIDAVNEARYLRYALDRTEVGTVVPIQEDDEEVKITVRELRYKIQDNERYVEGLQNTIHRARYLIGGQTLAVNVKELEAQIEDVEGRIEYLKDLLTITESKAKLIE